MDHLSWWNFPLSESHLDDSSSTDIIHQILVDACLVNKTCESVSLEVVRHQVLVVGAGGEEGSPHPVHQDHVLLLGRTRAGECPGGQEDGGGEGTSTGESHLI